MTFFLLLVGLGAWGFLWFTILSSAAFQVLPKRSFPVAEPKADFAIIVTVYKHAKVARGLVNSLLASQYPHFHIYVVEDQCPDTLGLTDDRLTVIVPNQAISSKVGSMLEAMRTLAARHSHVVVMDPDNLVQEDTLNLFNSALAQGFAGVQGRRAAKNLDSNSARLDAAGEMYYNYTTKWVPFTLGSSATIAGSGMAIAIASFSAYLKAIDWQPGKVITAEDKYLQVFLPEKGLRVAYEHRAIILDEKIDDHQVTRQRTRWLNAYAQNLPNGFRLLSKGLFTLNFNKWYMGVLNIYPPIFLLVAFSGFWSLVCLPFNWQLGVFGLSSTCLFLYHYWWVLTYSRAPKEVLGAFAQLPKFIWRLVLALLQIKKANKDFLATEHKAD